MKKVEAFLTEDGKLFLTEDSAEKHENDLRSNRFISRMVSSLYYGGISEDALIDRLLEAHSLGLITVNVEKDPDQW